MKNLLALFLITSVFVGCTDKKEKESTEETTTEVVTDSNSVKLEEAGTVSDTIVTTDEVVEPIEEVIEK